VIGRVLGGACHHFHLGGGLGLVDGPRLNGARRQEAEDDAAEGVNASGDEEDNLPRLACALPPQKQNKVGGN